MAPNTDGNVTPPAHEAAPPPGPSVDDAARPHSNGRGREGSPDLGRELPEPSVRFAIFAAVLGLVLLAIAIGAPSVDPAMRAFRWPMIAVGLSILMGAVGAQVVAQLKWVSAAGAAAMVLVFAYVFKIDPAPPPAPFVYGYLRGTEELPELVVRSDEGFFLTGRLAPGGFYHFFARAPDIRGRYFVVQAKNLPGQLPAQIVITCIPVDLLSDGAARTGNIDLELFQDDTDQEKQRWLVRRTGADRPIAVSGNRRCPSDGHPLNVTSLPAALFGLLLPPAAAQATTTVDAIVYGLAGDSLDSQARAQASLAKLRDPVAIQTLVRRWSPATAPDQMEAGLLLGWTTGIRQNRAVAVPIAAAMTPEQLDRLIELTGSRDRTVRYNATELLSWMLQSLAWPNPPPPAQSRLVLDAALSPYADARSYLANQNRRGAVDGGNVMFNTLVALIDAKCDMRPEDRSKTTATLEAFEKSDVVRQANLARTLGQVQQFRSTACPR